MIDRRGMTPEQHANVAAFLMSVRALYCDYGLSFGGTDACVIEQGQCLIGVVLETLETYR